MELNMDSPFLNVLQTYYDLITLTASSSPKKSAFLWKSSCPATTANHGLKRAGRRDGMSRMANRMWFFTCLLTYLSVQQSKPQYSIFWKNKSYYSFGENAACGRRKLQSWFWTWCHLIGSQLKWIAAQYLVLKMPLTLTFSKRI